MPIDPAALAVFIVTGFVLSITPGPNMLYVLANAVGQGPRAGLVSSLGVGVGALLHAVAAAFGLSAVLAASPAAFDAVRYAGAAYLVWLGVQAIRNPVAQKKLDGGATSPPGALFLQGVITNVLNPKVALFFLAFLPQFVRPETGSAALQIILLGLLFNVTDTGVNVVVAVFSGGLGQRLLRSVRFSRALAWFSGLVFIGLAARLMVSKRG